MTTPGSPENNPQPTPFPQGQPAAANPMQPTGFPAPPPAYPADAPQGGFPGGFPPNPNNPNDRFRPGTMGRRLGAYLIDSVIVGIPTFVLLVLVVVFSLDPNFDTDTLLDPESMALVQIDDMVLNPPVFWAATIVIIALAWLYWLAFDAIKGQTLGKKMLKLRIIPADDPNFDLQNPKGIGWGRAILRRLYFVIPNIPTVGGILSLVAVVALGITGAMDSERRTYMDKLAKARVIDLR